MFVLERKSIAAWNSLIPAPQLKTECISTRDVYIFGKRVGSYCDGYATFKKFYRIEYFAQITGPDRTEEYLAIAQRCLPVAFGTAYAAWVGTPGEFTIKAAAALLAGKGAFLACAGVSALEFEIVDEGRWGDWERV